MTKVHGKRYAYKFDFHALMQACQSQGHDATGGYKYATEFSAAAGLFSGPAGYQCPKLNGLTGAHLQVHKIFDLFNSSMFSVHITSDLQKRHQAIDSEIKLFREFFNILSKLFRKYVCTRIETFNLIFPIQAASLAHQQSLFAPPPSPWNWNHQSAIGMNNLSNLYSSASSMQPQQTHSHQTQAVPTSLPPPPLQKGSSSINTTNPTTENDSISTSPTSILSQVASTASASVTSSCFTSAASGFGPGLTSRDFRDFGLGVGRHHSVSSAAAAQTALDRYPYLSQTS